MPKTSWPKIVRAGDTGRFTWEQIDDAVKRAVARREAREARAARDGAAAGGDDAARGEPARSSGAPVRKPQGSGRGA